MNESHKKYLKNYMKITKVDFIKRKKPPIVRRLLSLGIYETIYIYSLKVRHGDEYGRARCLRRNIKKKNRVIR